jgi:L-ascorbate metabolism protein UlaG (beta-lactamase superfamily)
VKVTYVGHATVLIEVGGLRVLTDPVLRDRIGHVVRRAPTPVVEELLPLDAILVSHAHHDHLDVPSLRRVKGPWPVIAPRGAAPLLVRAGARNVIELLPGERCTVGEVEVEAVPAHHDGRRHPLGRRMEALGFVLGGVYFAGDTDLYDGLAELAGRVEVALIPIWGWGPRLPPGHLDPAGAARAIALIEPAVAVPIHFGTMRRLGMPPDDARAPALAFAAEVEALGLSTEVRILMPGEATGL